jgi:uncharacterized protein (TIGR02145 family)
MLLDIIKQIVAKEGEKILSEPRRVSAFFSDLAKDEPKPKKLAFIKCLEYDFAKILKDVSKEERANCKESLAKKLNDEEGLELKLCRESIDMLCSVLFVESEIIEVSQIPEATPAPVISLPIKQGYSSFTDPRDGKVYKTVKIGNQIWMAENLNYDAPSSKCYNNDPANAEKYGRLYDWNTAMKFCPPGWHLPTDAEWDILMNAVGGKRTAGKHLKAKFGWFDNGNGLDTYGFSALPGGGRYTDGSFSNAGDYGFWWSASEGSASYAYYRYMGYSNDCAGWCYNGKANGFSVRCLQD